MKLPVLDNDDQTTRPWYADGLEFTCTQCGNCCTGGPGYVWITTDEIVKLARHLGLTPEQTVERYLKKVDGKFSIRDVRNKEGNYDCIFLREQKVENGAPGEVRKTCSVYDARPLQCRTWPFWPENLTNRRTWNQIGKRCHGINQGRHFTAEQIHNVRDAAEWPKDPPSSE